MASTTKGSQGLTDSLVLERARSENGILLTLDKGVGNVVAFPPDQYPRHCPFSAAQKRQGNSPWFHRAPSSGASQPRPSEASKCRFRDWDSPALSEPKRGLRSAAEKR